MTKAKEKIQSALDVMLKRRSIRDFDERFVPKDIVQDIVRAAALAPTSCNMQLYHFVIVENPELLEKFKKTVTGKINWCHQMAVLLVDPKITFENEANYISAGMVVQNFLLRAVELGVGTCPIAGFKGKDILRRELHIPERYDIPLIIFFGYSKEMNSDPHVPYRLPTEKTFSYNEFSGDNPFPTTSSAKHWTQEAIFDYRRRILSVYFPRFGQSVYGKRYIDSIWSDIKQFIGKDKKILYIFPWEKDLLDRLSENLSIGGLDIADSNDQLTEYVRSKYSPVTSHHYDINQNAPENMYDVVLIIGSLEFNQDIAGILKYAAKSLKYDGVIVISTMRRFGILGLTLQILKLFGKQKDVYHNSLFYKLGPRQYISEKNFQGFVDKDTIFQLDGATNINTKYVESKFKSRILSLFVRAVAALLPESKMYVLRKFN